MRDRFFDVTKCDRCHGSLENGRILSMFNMDVLCQKCKDAETKHPDYRKATDIEREAVQNGNRNFPGIGYKP